MELPRHPRRHMNREVIPGPFLSSKGRGPVVVLLVTTIPLWIFYGPATIVSLIDVFRGQPMSAFDALLFVPPILLSLTTALAVLTLSRHRLERR